MLSISLVFGFESCQQLFFFTSQVCVAHIPGMRTVINEYNVQTEILNTGMAVKNPDHLDLLKALCQEMGHMSG